MRIVLCTALGTQLAPYYFNIEQFNHHALISSSIHVRASTETIQITSLLDREKLSSIRTETHYWSAGTSPSSSQKALYVVKTSSSPSPLPEFTITHSASAPTKKT